VIDLRRLQSVTESPPVRPEAHKPQGNRQPIQGFAQELEKARAKPELLHFSAHALDRMASRGIELSPAELERMQGAVDTAANKGSRASLVLLNERAFVVSVANRTVITALDGEALRDQIVTQIDSAVIL
jgi:flagellar operon protein